MQTPRAYRGVLNTPDLNSGLGVGHLYLDSVNLDVRWCELRGYKHRVINATSYTVFHTVEISHKRRHAFDTYFIFLIELLVNN